MKNKYLLFAFTGSLTALTAHAEKPVNILFCIADDASMWTLGAYGCKFSNTPAIDELAREGAIFNNAFTENPKSAPSRASLITGKHSWQLKDATDHFCHFPKEFTSYPQLLLERGYHVGYTGKGWGPGTYDTENNPAGPEYNEITCTPPYSGIHKIDYSANFNDFLEKNTDNKPFCFWLGAFEPHRGYEKDSWKKEGMKLSSVDVQPFFPDNDIVRGDILDYTVEVNWYDLHIGRAIKALKDKGQLENTLIIITSDHGMPFPRVKGQIYEEGFHIPFIVYWKGKIQAGTIIDDFIGFQDVAPTLMEAAGLKPHKQMTGKSFLKVLKSGKSGQVDSSRDHILLCKERHDIGRSSDEGVNIGYPVRAIRTNKYLYIHNYKPDRWPVCNPEFGFKNCDESPTKSYLVNLKPYDKDYKYFVMAFGKRPNEELYDIINDKYCLYNLAYIDKYNKLKTRLFKKMEKELKDNDDPRMFGNGKIFDNYPYLGKKFDYSKPIYQKNKQ